MGPSGPVLDALPHRVGLVPNYVGANPPPVGLQGEGNAGRDQQQVLRRQAGLRPVTATPATATRPPSDPLGPDGNIQAPPVRGLLRAVRVSAVGIHTLAGAGVAVAQVEPAGAVGPQYAPDLAEGRHQLRNVILDGGLQANSVGNAVIAQAQIRRAGDHHVDAFVGQGQRPGVGVVEGAGAIGPVGFHFSTFNPYSSHGTNS